MTHPLLVFIASSMAAPETPRLKRLRHAWVLLCAALILAVIINPTSVARFGPLGALPALLLLIAAPIVGLVYWRTKTRADAAWSQIERRSDDREGEA